ncbi:MAG: hypothetical protein ACK5PQ_05040 [Alphaproteobacteria bacterium]
MAILSFIICGTLWFVGLGAWAVPTTDVTETSPPPTLFIQKIQEEETLMRAGWDLLKEAYIGEKKVLRTVENLPALKTLQRLWLEERFPTAASCNLFAGVVGMVVFPKELLPNHWNNMMSLMEPIMEMRREAMEPFGELGLVLGSESKRNAFRKKNDGVAYRLMTEGVPQDDFIGQFIPLEGNEIATARWDFVCAYRAKKELVQHLEESGANEVEAQKIEQLAELEELRLWPAVQLRLSFYRDAFVGFFHQDMNAFLEPNGGIDDMWATLDAYKDSIKKQTDGSVLYKCLKGAQHEYGKKSHVIHEWVAGLPHTPPSPWEEKRLERGLPAADLDHGQKMNWWEQEIHQQIKTIVGLEHQWNEKSGNPEPSLYQLTKELKRAKENLNGAYEHAVYTWHTYKQQTLD